MDEKTIKGHLAINGWTEDRFGNMLKEVGIRTRTGEKKLIPHRLHFSDRVVRLERLCTYHWAGQTERIWKRIGSAYYSGVTVGRHPERGTPQLTFGGSEGFTINLNRFDVSTPEGAASEALADLRKLIG
jgi:hypothetical protein